MHSSRCPALGFNGVFALTKDTPNQTASMQRTKQTESEQTTFTIGGQRGW
jgi:hypothetical protein